MGQTTASISINKIHKAHYVLMNIECGGDVLDELTTLFRFNDAVIRNLIIKCKDAVTKNFYFERRRERKSGEPSEQKRQLEESAAETAVIADADNEESTANELSANSDANDAEAEENSDASDKTEVKEPEIPEED